MATTETLSRSMRADARRNRELIVTAARRLVAEQGTEAQIQDVAREAGVGVGTVYRHFPNKEALMGELIAQCARENAACGREALERDPAEAFDWMVRTSCDRMAGDAARRRVWNLATPEAFAYAEEAKEEMHAVCSQVIGRAHKAGALRKDFRTEDMGGLMCGLAAAIDSGAPGGWKRLMEFALDGLRPR
jgi:AcrR family transcriptional regulator